MFDRRNEDLAVADLPGLGGALDCLKRLVDLSGRNDDLHFDFGQKAHGVFSAAVDLRVALLPAVAFDFSDRHALQAQIGQRCADLLELERFDDCRDQLHTSAPLLPNLRRAVVCAAQEPSFWGHGVLGNGHQARMESRRVPI